MKHEVALVDLNYSSLSKRYYAERLVYNIIDKFDYIITNTKDDYIMIHKHFKQLWNTTSSSDNSFKDLITFVWNKHTKSFETFCTEYNNYFELANYLTQKVRINQFTLVDKEDLMIELNKREGMKAAWIIVELDYMSNYHARIF